MLITEKKLRRVIRDLLREQSRSDARALKKAAGPDTSVKAKTAERERGKSRRELKKGDIKQASTPAEKKEVRALHKWLKEWHKGMVKVSKIDARQEKTLKKMKASPEVKELMGMEPSKFEERYKRLDKDKQEIMTKLVKSKELVGKEDAQFAIFTLMTMSSDEEPQSASVVDDEESDEYAEEDAAQAKRAEEEKKRTEKTAPLGTEFDIGEDWTYKITDSDKVKIEDTGDLHFTVASGPSNVDRSYKLTAKDKNHKIVQKVKRLHPHLIDSLNF